MKHLLSAAMLVIVFGAAVPRAQQNRSEVMLRAAMETETVKGDLKGAIEQYKKIAEGPDRLIAARALLRLGDAYRKLGDGQAASVFERIVRDYGDQQEIAAVARVRLGARKSPPVTALERTVWAGPEVDPNGSISSDGRFLTFTDQATGDLAIRDLTTRTNRRLTNKRSWEDSSGLAEQSVISRNGQYVAYAWCDCRNRYSLRIADVKGAAAEPRLLFDNPGVAWIAPFDWSPDGKRIAVQLLRQDDGTAQIGWVGTDDGSLHVLKTIDWRRSGKVLFSSDGKYLAYDAPVDGSNQRDVFLIAIDGSREVSLVASPGRDVVVCWSPDGTRLLFASDRSGSTGLWEVAVGDGQQRGAADLVKSDIGPMAERALGVTAAGVLYFAAPAGGVDVYVGSLDLSMPAPTIQAARTGQRLVGFNRQPDWSPDGTLLAYVSSRGRSGRDTTGIAIESSESGRVIRELQPQLTYIQFPHWTADSRSLVGYGWDLKGGSGIYRVDAETGATMKLVDGDVHGPQLSPDGKTLYATRYGERMALVQIDVVSGTQRELVDGDDLSTPALSPDGRFLAVRRNEAATRSSVLLLRALASGESTELLRLSQPESLQGNAVSWTADGRSVLVRKTQRGLPAQTLLISLNGGSPRKVDISVPLVTGAPFSMHPDGRRVAFTAGQSRWEIRALENVLTKAR